MLKKIIKILMLFNRLGFNIVDEKKTLLFLKRSLE